MILVLFPLYGAGGLGSYIIKHAVNAVYLFEDAVGNLEEQIPVKGLNSCRHGVLGVYGADDNGVFVAAKAVLNADRL